VSADLLVRGPSSCAAIPSRTLLFSQLKVRHELREGPDPSLTPASTLISRVSRWLRDWTQREIVAGDEYSGIRQPSFTALVNDIYVFQYVHSRRDTSSADTAEQACRR